MFFNFLRAVLNGEGVLKAAKDQAVITGAAVLTAGLIAANRKREDPWDKFERESREHEEFNRRHGL